MEDKKTDHHGDSHKFQSFYPENTKPLENQVAGHCFDDDCFTIGNVVQ